MGAWGTSLYANDSASDIRGDYVDKLRRGKTNEEVTKELIYANRDIMGDGEEEPLFWFALADTQWNYGRLLPEVKEKALFFLEQDEELERWRESGQKQLDAWIHTLDKLKKKLNSPQSPEKKVYKYRLYKCKWKLRDVFAYRFSSDYSKEKGFYGQYVAFRKVSENTCWPGHIIPVVQVYNWIGSDLPTIEFLSNQKLLEQGFYPITLKYTPNPRSDFNIELFSTSQRVIPKDNLIFLGNIPGDDLIPLPEYWISYKDVGWESSSYNKKFEHYIIDRYLAWKDVE